MTDSSKKTGLESVIIRICPACGVVNPSGPSESCPHLQLVRFDGLTAELDEELSRLAAARRAYTELLAEMKRNVLEAVRSGDASVETPRKVRAGEVDKLYQGNQPEGLTLTPPATPKPKKPAKPKPKRKRVGPPPVNPRQLDLLALSEPKGEA